MPELVIVFNPNLLRSKVPEAGWSNLRGRA